METYTVKELTFIYPKKTAPAINRLSFSVPEGQFLSICGRSGCGKTTLLRQLKPPLSPHGVKSGQILFADTPLDMLSEREQSSKIGFVMQNPDNQIVTDKVWHELAFGLESLGYDTPTIRRRVAEMASFFGIQSWFHKSVDELSGGQKQLLNLASIMAMQPSVLILDEPTSQLDPIAATEFLDIVGKINRELGVTIIITEHRLDEVFNHASRVIVMDKGEIIADGHPEQVGMRLRDDKMFAAMPVPMRVYASVDTQSSCPITVQDGRKWLFQLPIEKQAKEVEVDTSDDSLKPSIEMEGVWFKYDKNLPDVIKGLNLSVYSGEITAILGGNGTGKSTALSLIAGLNTPYRGKVRINGIETDEIGNLFDCLLGVVPQDPQSLFVSKTLREDLNEMLSSGRLSKQERLERVKSVAKLCQLEHLMDCHPYDLSGGEQQRAALAKVLLLRPRILLLDEPTKGLDAEFKQVLAGILRLLAERHVTILMVSHDIEFCAEYADQCALFFDGDVVSSGNVREFFAGNSFYTTAANRMARGIIPDAITARDIISAIGGKQPPLPEKPKDLDKYEGIDSVYVPEESTCDTESNKLPFWRIIIAILSGICFISTLIVAWSSENFRTFISGGGQAMELFEDSGMIWQYTVLIVGIIVFALMFIGALNKPETPDYPMRVKKGKLPKRTLVAAVMILLAIPMTIYLGVYYLGDRKYYFISTLIVLETMLPFALVFEGRKPKARELIVIALLVAIAVAGRAAFFMLPQFKPVVAIVIISGVAFGGEAGFLVGALAGFVSNMFFMQGPWTPWQMFAFGIIGFLAGVAFQKGLMRRSSYSLGVFGAISTFVIYGGIMNTASVLMFQPQPTKEMFYMAYLQGIPFDLVHAAATVTFVAFAAQPMLEKLDRIKVKYELI